MQCCWRKLDALERLAEPMRFHRPFRLNLFAIALAAAALIHPALAAETDNAAAPCAISQAPVLTVSLPGRPFSAIPSTDGCEIYVSLVGRTGTKGIGAVAVLKRSNTQLSGAGAAVLDDGPTAMALTRDGTLLIAAAGDGVTFLDTARMNANGNDAVLGRLHDGGRDAIYVALTPDDHFLFISDEASATITVVDLQKARASNFDNASIVGKIPVGRAPVGLVFSPDGHTLYTTSEAMTSPDWPAGCKSEEHGRGEHRQGAVIVVDVARAEIDPANAVLQRIPAGCNPVRVALSPGGDRLYTSARGSDALLVFDTAKLVSGADDAKIASIAVGPSPVGVIVVDDGHKVIVGNSNRFSSTDRDAHQTLTVIDADKIASGADAVLGTIEVGSFPRELHVTADGKTLLVTNFGSNSLTLIDLTNMPIKPRQQ